MRQTSEEEPALRSPGASTTNSVEPKYRESPLNSASQPVIALEVGASKFISKQVLEDAGYGVHVAKLDRLFLQPSELSKFAGLILSADVYEQDPEWVTLAHLADPSFVMIMLVEEGNVRDTVKAMRAGCWDVIENSSELSHAIACLSGTMQSRRESQDLAASRLEAMRRLSLLTPRQAEVLERVLQGQPSKVIASDLSISQRTVENHRASIMTKTGSRSLPALARLAVAADGHLPAVPTRQKPLQLFAHFPAR